MRHDDFAWLVAHSTDIFTKYAGKWIAVRDGRVIATGNTAVEVDKLARSEAPDGDFILEAVEAEADVIYECSQVA